MKELTWVEISKEALKHNISLFRQLVGSERILCPCVKGNAYGHGLVLTSQVLIESGANWLGVNSLYEARALREAGILASEGSPVPIYILGYVGLDELEEAVNLGGIRLVVYNEETVRKLAEICERNGQQERVHLKVETGNNRQGVNLENLLDFAKLIKNFKNIELEGLSTHFANIEDTTDHSYAEKQLNLFNQAVNLLKENGIEIPIKHCANSAATLLFEKTRFEMVRPGISSYGMWPSNETFISYKKEIGNDFELKPALTWKTKIVQIKDVEPDEYIGYGCTYRTGHKTRLAILPIGYYDGYDRGINGAHVLIHGKRAPVRGRVCMNIIMVEVTDIPEVQLEDEVVLIGRAGEEEISAEQFAKWAGTINYEAVTRINERIPRILC